LQAGEKLALKNTSAMNAFNLLQDMRHLVIIDLRPKEAYDLGHIRKSLHADMTNFAKVLCEAIMNKHYGSHYEGDDLKRALFVLPNDQAASMEKQLAAELPVISAKLL
jgi:rhodanese-related sulfurtransferase